MYIDQERCRRCLDCLPVCPMAAIRVQNKEVVIDYEECVECGVCRRLGICEEEAILQVEEIPYPRIIRAVFSDPTITHPSTGVAGRGTEEMKTNDVTNNFRRGQIGFSIELGRPGVGAYLRDLEKVVKKVTAKGVAFARENPVFPLIADPAAGALRPEILNEKVLSAIVEFVVDEDGVLDFIEEIQSFMNAELETVATMSVIARADEQGRADFLEKLKKGGQKPYPNGKVNLGLAMI
jgi:NAD-dependent dihydropyrimidine dehydrogenase PreA subunit